MIIRVLPVLLLLVCGNVFSQSVVPQPQAHSHNDYEHSAPLMDALKNGFLSVEADVHLKDGLLFVSHNAPGKNATEIESLYLRPLDSLLKINGDRVYKGFDDTFYLMIDCKTEARSTYEKIKTTLARYPSLLCMTNDCGVKIFLSGNRSVEDMIREGYAGIGIDGRPDDLSKNYTAQQMPVISDNFNKWSSWNGKTDPSSHDLARIRNLADKVHREGKRLRLWAIPDNELAWKHLLAAGVDIINTDHLAELRQFLSKAK